MSILILEESGERNKHRDRFRIREISARETVAMFNMTGYVELKRLLTKVEAIEEKLMPNELEILRSLKADYVEPPNPDSFDATSLNVILRNVEIRKGTRFDPRRDGGRVINLPRRGVSNKNQTAATCVPFAGASALSSRAA